MNETSFFSHFYSEDKNFTHAEEINYMIKISENSTNLLRINKKKSGCVYRQEQK